MTTQPAKLSMEAARHRTRTRRPGRWRDSGSWWARYAIAGLVALTLGMALAGGLLAYRVVSDNGAPAVDGRVPTSFGALWVDSIKTIAIPKTLHKGHVGIPEQGEPERVALEVIVRLANTTAAPVELTPARFALRLGTGTDPIPVDGAAFESVRLLPGATFDARMQFPVKGGEHELTLLFDDPDGSGPITIDLGRARFPETADDGHVDH